MYYYKHNPSRIINRHTTAKNTHIYESTFFITKSKKFAFIGCSHEYGGSRTFSDFLVDVFQLLKPQVILLEADYRTPQSQVLGRLNAIPGEVWHENELAVYHSRKYKSAIRGMDESERIQNKMMIALKPDGLKLLIFNMFLVRYNFYRNSLDSLLKNDAYLITKYNFIKDLVDLNRQPGHLKKYFVRLKKIYGTPSMGKVLDNVLKDVVHKYIAPISVLDALNKDYSSTPYGGRYKISEYIAFFDAIRERRMYESCISALKRYDRVVAISGSWHAMQLRPILKETLGKKFGKVGVYTWKDFYKISERYK